MRPIHWMLTPTLLIALACGPSDGENPRAETPTPTPTSAPSAPSAPQAEAPEPPSADAAAQAQAIFETRCTTCHGPTGAGDGPGSAALDPKPRNFQDKAWQASVTDDHLEKIILYGGAAVGKSPAMPGNPDLQSKPEVTRALVAYVRGLAES